MLNIEIKTEKQLKIEEEKLEKHILEEKSNYIYFVCDSCKIAYEIGDEVRIDKSRDEKCPAMTGSLKRKMCLRRLTYCTQSAFDKYYTLFKSV